MKIPNGPSGLPTVSTTQFRTYGAGGFKLEEQEDDRGCPHLYWAKYVSDEPLPPQEKSYPLRYGSMVHDVLFAMEDGGLDPEEALQAKFDPTLPFEAFEEARRDLQRYLERGAAPRDRYATLAVEQHLEATLMVLEDGTEVKFRGFVDWIGVDPDDMGTIHVVDYKTNRSPIRQSDMAGDVQMRGYAWLVLKNAEKFLPTGARPNVVVHLDAIKFHEVEYRYSDEELDDWQLWAQAVARAILQDEEHKQVLNTYCTECPIRETCDEFQSMPERAVKLAGLKHPDASDEAKLVWREEANRMRLFLEKAVKSIDAEFADRARAQQGLEVGSYRWEMQIDWKTQFNMKALHAVLGDLFYAAVTTSKTALERVTKDQNSMVIAGVEKAIEQVPNGMRPVKRKAKG